MAALVADLAKVKVSLKLTVALSATEYQRSNVNLKDVDRRRKVQSKERVASPAYRVALAGYTNAGKSTLLQHAYWV